ncbi:hypothetical protein B0T10DRAFT_248414 [Thelonectria olida]|uniref:Secreted protein n=1 Tax=Thelonectria olida TaxID=1576542 RepID=A0A9P8W9T9_9HYPO|nr:hypothetical protein B0T10DRAFT_248414 [Thelonectria olida]
MGSTASQSWPSLPGCSLALASLFVPGSIAIPSHGPPARLSSPGYSSSFIPPPCQRRCQRRGRRARRAFWVVSDLSPPICPLNDHRRATQDSLS